MVVRRLTVPGTTGDHRVDYPEFEAFKLSLAGVSYEKSKHDLIGSVLKFNKQDDLSSVFCSGNHDLTRHTVSHFNSFRTRCGCVEVNGSARRESSLEQLFAQRYSLHVTC